MKELITLLSVQMMIKKIQPTDSIKSYAYRARKDLANGKEELKCNNIIK